MGFPWTRRPRWKTPPEARYLSRWAGIGLLVGVGCALGALAFLSLIGVFTDLLLVRLVGLHVSTGPSHVTTFVVQRWWLLPLVTAAGGLVGGLLTWRFAPEAAGIGTDSVIRAFHQGRPVSMKTTVLKLFTASLTVGSGGTSGVEGPIAQVGAGMGSLAGRILRLSPRDRAIAMAAGLGAGIAAVFKAPLAGTIIAAEVFYREDFEVEALVPTLFASVIGYSIVGFFTGWEPLYATHLDPFRFGNPLSLVLYAVLGITCALAARSAFGVFFPVQRLAKRLPLPVSTTVGGLLAGLVAVGCLAVLGVPVVIATGHEWLQNTLLDAPTFTNSLLGPATLLVLAALAELLGNTFTIGTGNSGGIFGPSLVVGGFVGGAFALTARHLVPGLVPDVAPFVIVGMISYFAAVVKAPLGTIVMVVEITGGYGLLGPAMVGVMFSFLLSGHQSLFVNQVKNRLASAAHADEFEPLVLRQRKVADLPPKPLPPSLAPTLSIAEALAMVKKSELPTLPVTVGDQRLLGVVSGRDLQRVPEWDRERPVADVMTTDIVVAHPQDDLFHVLSLLLERNLSVLPVVDPKDATKFLGTVSRSDLVGTLQTAKRARQDVAAPAAMPA